MSSSKRKAFMIAGVATAVVAGSVFSDAKSKKNKEEGKENKYLIKAEKVADQVTAEPSTALETMSMLESFGSSLMRRDSKMQGVMTGLSVLSARGVSHITERLTKLIRLGSNSYISKFLSRVSLVALSETAIFLTKNKEDTNKNNAINSSARVLSSASVSGLIYDSGKQLSKNSSKDNRSLIRSILLGSVITA